jgi:small GTP-binding protein
MSSGVFPAEYILTIGDYYRATAHVGRETVTLEMIDTKGSEDYDRLRPISYAETDAFLLCYSVASRESYDHIRAKWIPEILQHCPNAKMHLIGTKIDLREDPTTLEEITTTNSPLLPKEAGRTLAATTAALVGSMECSALTQVGVSRVLEEVSRSFLLQTQGRRPTCCLL